MACDDGEEEGVVPAGGFAFDAEAVFAGCRFHEVEGHVFDGRHVFGAVGGSQAHEIVVEDGVEHSVEAVFDAPMGANGLGEEGRIKRH